VVVVVGVQQLLLLECQLQLRPWPLPQLLQLETVPAQPQAPSLLPRWNKPPPPPPKRRWRPDSEQVSHPPP